MRAHPPAEGTLQESSAKERPLRRHPNPATNHDTIPAGPAISWQMRPVITNTPLREECIAKNEANEANEADEANEAKEEFRLT